MRRFFVEKEAVKGGRISISGKEAHHALNVMRLKEREKVVAFDGTGKEYVGVIKEIRNKALLVEIVEERTLPVRECIDITLLQAIPKKDKMDYIIEKATELGVHSVIPIVTARTIPDWDNTKKAGNVERWRKIAREASKQCGRPDIPKIDRVKDFGEAIGEFDERHMKFIAVLSEEAVKLKDALSSLKGRSGDGERKCCGIAAAIGPEGDFTDDEVRGAKAAGFRPIGLGPTILKSDTAALVALSILNYELSG